MIPIVRQLFQGNNRNSQSNTTKNDTSTEKLIEIQTRAMMETYHTTCFNVKKLQEVLGIGETNAYRLIRSGVLPSQTIGGRKVVPVVAVARFLVMGEKKP